MMGFYVHLQEVASNIKSVTTLYNEICLTNIHLNFQQFWTSKDEGKIWLQINPRPVVAMLPPIWACRPFRPENFDTTNHKNDRDLRGIPGVSRLIA